MSSETRTSPEPATTVQPALFPEYSGTPAEVLPAARTGLGNGLLMALLGAWGAVVAYVGPSFGYGPVGAHSWAWTTPHAILNLLPGAAAFVAGVLCILDARGGRAGARMGGLLAFGAGAWFVLGPAVYPIFYRSPAPSYAATGHGALASFATLVGYGLGVGVALCLLAGMVLMSAPRRVVTRRAPVPEGLRHERAVPLRNTDPAAV